MRLFRTVGDVAFTDKRTGDMHLALNVERNVWEIEVPPIFTQDRPWLQSHIPKFSES